MTPEDLTVSLAQFSGTENYYRHWSHAFNYTDGVAFLAENAGCHWFLDVIASYQKKAMKDRMLREFQVWKLVVKDSEADVICLRDTDDEAFRQHIPFTDFPLRSVKLYLENNVLMLPGER